MGTGRCPECDCRFLKNNPEHPRAATVDHIIPRGLGGGDEPDNWQVICHACNAYRNRRLTKALARLRQKANGTTARDEHVKAQRKQEAARMTEAIELATQIEAELMTAQRTINKIIYKLPEMSQRVDWTMEVNNKIAFIRASVTDLKHELIESEEQRSTQE